MPVIKKPTDRGSLLGDRAAVILGGGLAKQLRQWQEAKHRPLSDSYERKSEADTRCE